ncbi:MAG: MoaD/ThiS family protein [Desulfotomaculaceae bacterium]|nr:MoaD/ThiS family protein [Desulfotomaculaceae bacterium]
MNRIMIRFFAELNDYIPSDRRQRTFSHFFTGQPSVKDVIESLGVPHDEVCLVLVNGQSASFDHRLSGGETVAVYPVFQTIDISPVTKVWPDH